MKLWLWLTPILICISTVSASNAQQEKQEEDKCCCSTFETGQCLIALHKKVDAELNEVYQQALKREEPEHVKNLRKAQRAWINYRDANCDAEYATYGRGTMGPNMSALCRIKLTRQRIEEIKRIYLPAH